ncbi:MAG: LysM peptidoglycan-binding domain-containing protein [Actinobacteria bacterium]|nr:LysM peptidoglycan-binding domain-containing protein [Actinomycetota bacterium]
MKSMVLGVLMVVAASSLGLVACGGDDDQTGSSTPIIDVSPTNYVTVAPEPATSPPVTTAPDAPGTILQYDTDYTLQEGDDAYASNVYYRWKIPIEFAAWIEMNGFTFDAETGIVAGWPPAGSTIKIPAGSTVPGEPPPSAGTTVPADGSTDGTTEATTAETDPPETEAPTTTGSDCTPGSYTIVEGDYPGLVAQKFDVTVGALNAANQSTKYYSSFAVGVKIVIPC